MTIRKFEKKVYLGIIPGGFKDKAGVYEDIHIMYHML